MADNGPTAATSTSAGGNESRGSKRAHPPDRDGSNKRGRGGRGRGSDRHGGRGRGGGQRGRDRGNDKKSHPAKNPSKHKRTEMSRQEWKNSVSGRKRDDEKNGKNPWEGSEHATTQFSKEEIEAEGRKPKRKVAVLIGYAGSGYKGMQINATEKTIEGDIFKAFVAAGAISKANADDPKKSSLVRCARTDKGVHAAGNVISLKLIVEDPDIVKKINDNLPPQIRVWGMERTNAAFSCYASCDSRWYEYLIPTFSFLPPHPKSYMGKQLLEYAEREGKLEEWKARQADVADFWEKADEKYIQPILDEFDKDMQDYIMAEIHATSVLSDEEVSRKKKKKAAKSQGENGVVKEKERAANEIKDELNEEEAVTEVIKEKGDPEPSEIQDPSIAASIAEDIDPTTSAQAKPTEEQSYIKPEPSPIDNAIRRVKAAYIEARKSYRITPARKALVQNALNQYLGTHNFHNYTINKLFSDPSAKRVIRSFSITPTSEPLIANDTEWLSLKVHGQSFMMHQIRKMVAMATCLVRCGADVPKVMQDSFGGTPISIPKAPALGLLLERPVFENYNAQAEKKFGRERLDFDKWKAEMEAFKQREIYERMWREEDGSHQYHTFFHHLDHYRTDHFLWMTAGGLAAARHSQARNELLNRGEEDSDSDQDIPDADGQEG